MNSNRNYFNPSTRVLRWLSGIIALVYTFRYYSHTEPRWWGYVSNVVNRTGTLVLAGVGTFVILYVTREAIRRSRAAR